MATADGVAMVVSETASASASVIESVGEQADRAVRAAGSRSIEVIWWVGAFIIVGAAVVVCMVVHHQLDSNPLPRRTAGPQHVELTPDARRRRSSSFPPPTVTAEPMLTTKVAKFLDLPSATQALFANTRPTPNDIYTMLVGTRVGPAGSEASP